MNPQIYNSNKNPIITKNFDCSTAHISKLDNALLKRAVSGYQTPVIVYNYREGYFVYVPYGIGSINGVEAEYESIKKYGLSEAFINLLKIAARLECKYLQLDADAMEYEDLPTFDW